MTIRFIHITALTFAVALVAGCAVNRSATAEGAPLARQVTESDHCGLTATGLVYISNASELDKLESLPSGNLSMNQLRALDLEQEHLLLVGLGQKPTGGFGLTLAKSQIVEGTFRLSLILRRPPADAMVTQALTTPCAVLAISPDHWKRLEVTGNGLETLRLEP